MTYFQQNAERFKDYRVFIETRVYYDLNNLSFYLKTNFRHHSTPYIDIIKNDLNSVLGIEFKL